MSAAPVEVRLARTAEERRLAYELRHRVFVVEQRVPVELERDEHDEGALHVVALEAGETVGTGRLVAQPGGVGRVGRMAVRADRRRRGVGERVLELLENLARERGLSEIELHAQAQVERFYLRAGYRAEGEHFDEAGIDHVLMRKRLSPEPPTPGS